MAEPKPLLMRASALPGLQAGVAVTAAILTGFAFWALRRILEPLVLAVFLLLMIDALARVLVQRLPRFPERGAAPAAVAVIVAVFALGIWLAADSGSDFAAHSALYQTKLNALLAEGAARLGLHSSPTLSELVQRANPAKYAGAAADGLRNFGEGAVFVLIYLFFLLASRRGFARKWPAMFDSDDNRAEAERVFGRIRAGVESYVWVQTLIGLLIAGVSMALMLIVGLPHAFFWAFLIFLANYVPAIGAAVGVLIPPLFALMTFDGLVRPIVLLVGMETVHVAVTHFLQPKLQGRSLNLDPLVVVFALAFWGAIWGVVGAFLSTPLTVAAMAILAESRATRPIAVLLSGDGKPYADVAADAQRER